ncbi:MAG: BON domain-containing protein [Candidatus Omnitrophota bacterium]|jgi:hypothetical protein
MENANGLTNGELKELILEHLDEMGVAPGAVEVRILKGPKVVLEGKVDSDRKKDLIIRYVRDVAGLSDIVDELIVIEDLEELEEDHHEDYELYDEDNEYVGSEDVFRAVEDGVPYVPPTEPPTAEYSDMPEPGEKRKKRPRRHE